MKWTYLTSVLLAFFKAGQIGIKLLMQRDKAVDVGDLAYWIRRRAEAWDSPNNYNRVNNFAFSAADIFYRNQLSE